MPLGLDCDSFGDLYVIDGTGAMDTNACNGMLIALHGDGPKARTIREFTLDDR